MKINQLPPLPKPDIAQHTQEVWIDDVRCTRQLGPRYTADQMRAYALQARAQVQGEPFGYIHHFAAHDESGALIDTTWEADGCADPLPHPASPSMWKWAHCTPFYTTPQPAQATQAKAQQPATTEPVLTVEREPDYWSGGHFYEGNRPHINPMKVWSLPIGTKLYTHPVPSVPKDHQIAALVNKVRDIARMFHDHQSLRERIAIELVPALKAPQEVKSNAERVPMTGDERGEAYLKQSKSYEGYRSTFMRGVWAAEAHHGITAQEGTNGEVN